MRRRNVAYIRVANENNYALEEQKSILNSYAKSKNFEIDYYYIDNGYSGTNLDRPQLRQLLRDVKSGKVTEKIIFKDITTLSRDKDALYKILNQLSKRNVEIISTISDEVLKINMIMAFFQMQRRDEKYRMRSVTKQQKR